MLRRMTLTRTQKSYDLIRSKYMSQRGPEIEITVRNSDPGSPVGENSHKQNNQVPHNSDLRRFGDLKRLQVKAG